MKWLGKNILILLDILKFVGIMALIMMFITFNAKVVSQTKTTQNIVKSQSDILAAIKQLAMDNKITSEQKANLIICMLQVPVEQRTTDTLENCKRQANNEVSQATLTPAPAKTDITQSSNTDTSTEPAPTQPAPTPQPERPRITKSITDFVAKQLKRIGL